MTYTDSITFPLLLGGLLSDSISKSSQKSHDIFYFLICEAEITQFCVVDGFSNFRRGPFPGIACVIEAYHFFQRLEDAIVHIGRRKGGIAKRRYFEIPIQLRLFQHSTEPEIYIFLAIGVILLRHLVERIIGISRNTKIVVSVIGEERGKSVRGRFARMT